MKAQKSHRTVKEPPKLTVETLRNAIARAAEEAFQSEEIDTQMWELRDEGVTKTDWIEDKIEGWIQGE